ncbi:MAG: tRNA (N6-isopentenyl adenosine(37)-C2)-methylthiotransferase MiaB [Deltaproteobacteria bacterium]|nr:tRNA (N6-isopentenyl adenosine(37)-C2)-methylthiotransferase MiaB [Deltaproteobacteria bacterium]
MTKRFHITTFGCQMNEYDSSKVANILAPVGYIRTDEIREADLILINTCSVREKAEQKVYSLLGRLKRFKQRKPSTLIGVGGCVAQQKGESLLDRVGHLDFVFGTHAFFDLPQILAELSNGTKRLCYTDLHYRFEENPAAQPGSACETGVKGLITIMRGCDNFCTFCVVPYVRGREVSRSAESILNEATGLLRAGVKEITLLGQNVNSYLSPDEQLGFSELLERMNELDGLQRIRFTTSHPKDLSPALVSAFGRLSKLCPHIHLPLQSGSNRILKRMNRRYTREDYLTKIEDLRKVCPDISITTDLIVGFPGESEEDFQETLDMLQMVKFDGAFSFKYSDRVPAKAVRFEDKISEETKSRRLRSLQAIQKKITMERNMRFERRIEWVLVESRNKRNPLQLTGRIAGNQIVNFEGSEDLIGQIVPIRIEEGLLHSLRGRPALFTCQGGAP